MIYTRKYCENIWVYAYYVVILTALAGYKGATKIPNQDGDLPLRKALQNKCSKDIVLALIEADKFAVCCHNR
jgi:hypothetical protein